MSEFFFLASSLGIILCSFFLGFCLSKIIQIRRNLRYLDKLKEKELWQTPEGRARFDGIMEVFREVLR